MNIVPQADPEKLARMVLRRYPHSFAEQAGIRSVESPSGLFRLLVMALLMSARIRSSIALDAAKAVFSQRWTTASAMAQAGWADRTRVLNRAGYARYDERTSRMLGDTSEHLLERYGGDLRRLRDQAGRDPAAERRLLKGCKGIGDVGVDIFFREVQQSWPEVYPFVDQRALRAAVRVGMGDTAEKISSLAGGRDFVRLVDGLVQMDFDKSYQDIVS